MIERNYNWEITLLKRLNCLIKGGVIGKIGIQKLLRRLKLYYSIARV
jgi:hypothetical protein